MSNSSHQPPPPLGRHSSGTPTSTSTQRTQYSLQQIEQALDDYLGAVLSSRRTSEEAANGLATLPLNQQEFALHWTDVISKSNSEMAYQFVSQVPRALEAMGIDGTQQWLLRAMDVYDKEGLYPGSAEFARVEEFACEYRLNHVAVTFNEVRPVLERFICGLSGRNLQFKISERIYTDTETLYLPARIQVLDDREKNQRLYKAIAVHLWAQSRFGTFRRDDPDAPHLTQRLAEFDDSERALKLFNLLETIRLNACINRELPGLAREMRTLDTETPPQDETWKYFAERLQQADASVADTIAATTELYPLQMKWAACMYQGELDLDAARVTIDKRLESEKAELQWRLGDLLAEQDEKHPTEKQQAAEATDPSDKQNDRFELDATQPELNGDSDFQLKLDGEAIAPPDIDNLLASIRQDLTQIPDDWLSPAGDGAYDGDNKPQNMENQWAETASHDGAFFYDEWDFRRQNYRKNWCVLRELPAHPVYDNFVEQTVHKYLPLVTEIRRHFETLRGEDKRLKAQPAGDNIDFDALITAHADARTGVEMSDRLFTRMNKVERDLAVVFMVDISGSTKGWINDAERESLILLCEALEILGDQYAIYGFSGMTRNRCEIHPVKTFAQPYDRETSARISGLRPQDYTRMGVAIRHLSKILLQAEARTRILITLSDGKPDDYDGYHGEYGIEDTRQALLEARHSGLHPFCITIDRTASDYLPHMYGHASYTVLDEVRKLPLQVANIYRKLTT